MVTLASLSFNKYMNLLCCCVVAKSCLTLCDPMDYSMQTSLSLTISLHYYFYYNDHQNYSSLRTSDL